MIRLPEFRRPGLDGLSTGLVVLITAWLLTWSVVDEWRYSSERIGVYISQTEVGIMIDSVDAGSPAERAGLLAGDRLMAVEGLPVATLEELDIVFDRHFRPGDSLEGTVERDSRQIPIELYPGVALDLPALLARFILVAAYLGLGLLASRYHGTDRRARLLTLFVTLVALEMALPAGHTLAPWALTATLLFWLLATGIQFGLELHLVSLIPSKLGAMRRHPWLVPGCHVVGIGSGLLLCAVALLTLPATPEPGQPSLLERTQSAVMLIWAALVTAILAWQAARADTARGRNQALLVLAGLLPWALYIVVPSLWSGWELLDPALAGVIESVVLLAFPAMIFLAIFRYGLLDAEALVRRGMIYAAIALLVIVGLYTLLTMALPLFEARLGERTGEWIVIACAVVIGALFRPLRRGLERLVERGFFPRRRALRHRLIQIGISLSNNVELDTLIRQLAEDTRQALGVNWAAVVATDQTGGKQARAFSHDLGESVRRRLDNLLDVRSEAFELLDQRRRPITINRLARRHAQSARALAQAGAEILVPLYYRRRMIGILCLGSKLSGELFRREEIELLDLFSHQVATSLENLRLFQDATYERLTGLLRREVVLRQLEIEAARAIRQDTPLSAFMIDLDHFKAVNDTHGHLFGDRILRQVAAAMSERIRDVDALGRYGGEEFFLVLPDTGPEGARTLAESIRRSVSGLSFEPPAGGASLGVTVSIGIASAGPGRSDPQRLADDLLGLADAAVYEAKSRGRNQIVAQRLD